MFNRVDAWRHLLGASLRRALPEHHLSKDSQDVVRLGVGLLGNSRACARFTYRRREEFIPYAKYPNHADHRRYDSARQLACGVWAGSPSDPRTNAQYHWSACQPTFGARSRQAQPTPFEFSGSSEKAYGNQSLSPQNDLQRSLQARAAQLSTDLVQTRLILFAESTNVIPTPFLAILVLWIVIIFASLSLFSRI